MANHIKSQPRYISTYICSFLDDRDQRKKVDQKIIIEFGYSLYHIEHPSEHVLEQSDWQERSKVLFQAVPSKHPHAGTILKDSLQNPHLNRSISWLTSFVGEIIQRKSFKIELRCKRSEFQTKLNTDVEPERNFNKTLSLTAYLDFS